MVGVVEAVAALDAQALVVGRAVAALDVQDAVVLDVVGQLAAHAAIGADRLDLFVGHLQRHLARGHQRAGGTGLHAFAAGHASRGAHGVVHVEHDLRMIAAMGQPDHVIDLFVAAGAQAARALDAGIQVDGDGRMRGVGGHRRARGEARLAHAQLSRPEVHFVVARVRGLGHVGLQQFEHHLLRAHRAPAVCRDLHAGARRAAARRRQHAFTGDLDHARTAVADRLQSVGMAQAGNLDTQAIGDLDQRFVVGGADLLPVQAEGHGDRGEAELAAIDGIHVNCPWRGPMTPGSVLGGST